jgi:two-component system NtrC family response regulator
MSDATDRGLAALLIGESAPMRRVRELVRRIAPSSLPVLIQGPTGSGKELVARALHLASGREGAFVAFNVCAIADGMFEDSLFGHVRGAFTGAIGDSPGYLLEGHKGSVFLDEISGLSLASQAKLLRAIETKEFRPVGSRADRRSDFRLVSATNEILDDIAGSGRFRNDLLFRLRGVLIEVPSLSERPSDIPLLARHFAAGTLTASGKPALIANDAVDLLARHHWRGNVRELKAAVECATALTDGELVTRTELVRSGALCANATNAVSSRRVDFAARRLLEVLNETEWDVDRAAAILGVHRATVYRRLERMGEQGKRGGVTPPADAGPRRFGAESWITERAE